MPLVDHRNQAKVKSGDALIKHLKTFKLEPKFSAGVWFFAPGAIRFHDAYHRPLTIAQRLEIAADLAPHGLKGVEAHYPNEVNEENIHLYKRLEREAGVRLITIIPNLFWDSDFAYGSLSNPVKAARQKAVDLLVKTLKMNRQHNTDFAVVWPGGDGYELSFGLRFHEMWSRFEDGLAEAMDEVPGVRIAIEPKPYEPRGNNIWRNTADGVIMCADVEAKLKHPTNNRLLAQGHKLVTMNPELGHVLMGFEDFPYSLARILRQGRLAHTHWNNQPLGNYDQDLNVGACSPDMTFSGLYVMKMHGYRGYYGIDIFPERMPIRQALLNNFDRMKALMQMCDAVDHEYVAACVERPDLNAGTGLLEAYLTRLWHKGAKGMSALPKVRKS
ncbi:MAG: TIM barrel protein [Verrucomicrobia bacterium]|nr:TIM barrel protein [Verrucomicrobiota bacterium]